MANKKKKKKHNNQAPKQVSTPVVQEVAEEVEEAADVAVPETVIDENVTLTNEQAYNALDIIGVVLRLTGSFNPDIIPDNNGTPIACPLSDMAAGDFAYAVLKYFTTDLHNNCYNGTELEESNWKKSITLQLKHGDFEQGSQWIGKQSWK